MRVMARSEEDWQLQSRHAARRPCTIVHPGRSTSAPAALTASNLQAKALQLHAEPH